jgi:hypothetical protein
VDALVELGGIGDLPVKKQFRRIAEFEKKWMFQLRRLYPGTDFLWLAPILLDAASDALMAFQRREQEPESVPVPGSEPNRLT